MTPVNDEDWTVPPGYWRRHAGKDTNINTGSPNDEDAGGSQPAAREGMSRVAWDDGEVRSTCEAGNDRRGKGPKLKGRRRKQQGSKRE